MAYLNQTKAREYLAELEQLAREAPIADLRLAPLRKDLAAAITAEDEKNAALAAAAKAPKAPKSSTGNDDKK